MKAHGFYRSACSTISFADLKEGMRVEVNVLVGSIYKFMPATVEMNPDVPALPVWARLDFNGEPEPIFEHRMNNVRVLTQ